VRVIGPGANFSKVLVVNNLKGGSFWCDTLLGVRGSGSSIANSLSVVGNLVLAFKLLKSQNVDLGLASSRVSETDIYGGSLFCRDVTLEQRQRLINLRVLSDDTHLIFGQQTDACLQCNNSCGREPASHLREIR
jgi:hypothetical protein